MAEKELYRINDNQNHFSAVLKPIVLFLCFIASLFIGTEYIVLRTGREGFYQPFSSILWTFQAQFHGESTAVYLQGIQISIVCIVVSFLLFHFVSSASRRKVKESDIHGSAKWADYDDLKKANLVDNDEGFYIGGWFNKKKHCIEYLRDKSPGHCIVIAPPRSGKGVGIVIPNLLTFPGSVIVFDMKGENYHVTSGHRKNVLNNYILAFDPTSDNPNTAKYNPLNEVRMGLHEFEDAQTIAEMMIDPDKKGDTDHWRRAAISLLVCSILHTLYARKDKTLTGVVNLLSDPKRPVYEVLDSMLDTIHDPQGKQHWEDSTTKAPTKTHPIIASMAREFKNKGFEELNGIISTALAYLTLFRDPIIARNTSRSDFTIDDIIKGDKPRSMYLIVPPSNLQRMVPLTRLFLNQVAVRLMENKNLVLHNSMNTNHRLLMMLDEFNALGKMVNLKDSLSFMAQYGIRVCLIVQDLDQLYELYGEKNPILSYCHIRIAHATNSDVTARRISGLAGDRTLVKYSQSYSDGGSKRSDSASEIKRPLIMPDEVMRLPKDEMLIFVENEFPIRGKKIIYYEDDAFKEMASHKPVEKSDVLPTKSDYSSITGVVEYQRSHEEDNRNIYRPGLSRSVVLNTNQDDKVGLKEKCLVYKKEIETASLNGKKILDKLMRCGILADSSFVSARLMVDLEQYREKVSEIAEEDFNRIWAILERSRDKKD